MRSLPLQVVDLRWGIRNVPSGDHEACEVFLEEIQRCEQMSAGPTFIVSALSSSSPGQRLRLDCSHKCLFLLTFYACLVELKCLYFFLDFNFFLVYVWIISTHRAEAEDTVLLDLNCALILLLFIFLFLGSEGSAGEPVRPPGASSPHSRETL